MALVEGHPISIDNEARGLEYVPQVDTSPLQQPNHAGIRQADRQAAEQNCALPRGLDPRHDVESQAGESNHRDEPASHVRSDNWTVRVGEPDSIDREVQ